MPDTTLFMNLIKKRLCLPAPDSVCAFNLSTEEAGILMDLAQRHDVTAIIGSVLLEEDMISSEDLRLHIQEVLCQTACYYEIMNHELQWIHVILEDAQIPHVVLKGGAVRDHYPEPWMRTSGDMDILIPEDLLTRAEAALLKKGCIPDGAKRYHDIPLRTPANNLLELHFSIREDIPALDKTLDRVWDYCEIIPGKQFQYRQSTEFLIFHLLAHMSYHLTHGGCGIRSFVDIFLLLQKDYDSRILNELCRQAQLDSFLENVRQLNDIWFGDGKHTPVTQLLEQLVISGGTFGTKSTQILMEQAHSGNKRKYFLGRIFMPYGLLKKQYPILEKWSVLFPVFQVIRWFRILFTGRSGIAVQQLQTGHSHSCEQIRQTKQLLREIGLNF